MLRYIQCSYLQVGVQAKSWPNLHQICPFIVKEFSKATTHRQTMQSVGYSISNKIETTTPFADNTHHQSCFCNTAKLVNTLISQSSSFKPRHLLLFRNFSTSYKAPPANSDTPISHPENVGNYLPMLPCALPTGNQWWINQSNGDGSPWSLVTKIVDFNK